MLDNLLWSLRMLCIDPRDHLAFPQRQRLEEYQKAIDQRQRPPV